MAKKSLRENTLTVVWHELGQRSAYEKIHLRWFGTDYGKEAPTRKYTYGGLARIRAKKRLRENTLTVVWHELGQRSAYEKIHLRWSGTN
jgi:hypothetical protein